MCCRFYQGLDYNAQTFIKKLIMRKIFLFVSIWMLTAFTISDGPVPSYVYSGYKVTSAGTAEVELQFSDLPTSQSVKTLVYVQVDASNSGTIQFSAGRDITASYNAYAAGAKIPVSVYNGYYNLRYKASASSQSFTVTH
jgi:hypothetical protein